MSSISGPCGWRTSSYSSAQTNCVEVGRAAGRAAVRDSKDRAAGYFVADVARWSAFVDALKAGRFDR
ncbi:DUF397 domain-containing protein [Saccharopolyspora sp. MS10]|uniref:DUF397 domain-containing protein n=1 Tax=Saccharopolyspora sp. MS10 TaxID=3385973 RepID=UPI0039A0A13C